MFETLHIVSIFFGIWDNKIIALFGKLLSELSQMPSARPQESFAEHHFFYQRNYVFCLKRGSAAIFLSRGKKAIQVSQNSNARVYRKHLWELYFEKLFFFQLFGLWAEKHGLFLEKYWHVCQNCSKSVRPKKFPEKCFWIADLSSILNVDQEEFGIYREKLGWDFKTKFYVSRGTLTEQRFWQKLLQVSGLSAE